MLADTSEWVGTTLCEGRYRVLRKLGEGGMAHVYLARDDKLERDVVIKVPRANLIHDATFAGRFTREVRSLAKLAHPHVVPLIDIGAHDGVPFAVMHYLTGGSLRDRQARGEGGQAAPMPIESLPAWLPAIAQALDFVHKNKYVHRDVKPENILFDDDGQVFLSDLGIVKALTDNQDPSQRTAFTGAGMVLGTPHYMAPELILGETVDGRVDQYALAVTVYEALTGQFPFNGASAPAIFIQQTTKPPPPLRDALPSVPAPLAAAVDKALAKSARDRFATCTEFVQAAIGGGSGAHVVAPTLMEKRDVKDPVLATLIEAGPSWKDTPSDLKKPTAVATGPAAWNSAAPRRRSSGRSAQRWLFAGLAAAAIAVAAVAAFWMRGSAGLKLAAVPPLSLLPGDKQSIRIGIERQDLDGEVSCWLEGLPDGVKTDHVLVPADKTEGTIELAILTDAAPKTVTATLKAKCQNIEASVPVEIAIKAPESSVRFLSIAPCSLKAGEIETVSLHIERKNCPGTVAISVGALPPGVTWHRLSVDPPVIPEDQTFYPLQLKAAAGAKAADPFKVIVTGEVINYAPAVGALLLTVVAAPSPPTEPKVPDPIVKKTTPTPPDPEVVKDKPVPPKVPTIVPVAAAELILVPLLDVVLQPGERRTVWVQIERKNCAGPVAIAVAGLPLEGGVTVEPAVQPLLPETRLALSFDLVAAPSATDSKSVIGVTATLGDLRKTNAFNFTIQKKRPPPQPVAKDGKVSWQKSDKLTDADPLDRVRTNSRSKSFPVFLKAGQTYTIDMMSDAFDSYLRIENDKGAQVAADDDSGGGLNARVTFTAETSGIHRLIATSYTGGKGDFTLTVR